MRANCTWSLTHTFDSNTNSFMRALSCYYSHFSILLHWGISSQHMNFGDTVKPQHQFISCPGNTAGVRLNFYQSFKGHLSQEDCPDYLLQDPINVCFVFLHATYLLLWVVGPRVWCLGCQHPPFHPDGQR